MKKLIWLAVLVVVVVVILGSLSPDADTTSEKSDIATVKPLKIGAILPLTGPIASAGEYAKQGIELAMKDLAKDGRTPRVEVFFEDSQYDSKASLAAYNKLKTTQNPQAYIAFGSPAVMPLAPLVNTDRVPLMGLLTATNYSTPGDYTFRNIATGEDSAKVAADMIIDKLSKKRIAIMYLNNEYGVSVVKYFKQFVGDRATLVAEETATAGATDYRVQLTKIKNAGPDVVFLAMIYKDAGLFVKQAQDIGLKTLFVGDQPIDAPEFFATAGAAAEGTLVISPTAVTAGEFDQSYRQLYGMAPSYLSIRMYDAVRVFDRVAALCVDQAYAGECLKDKLFALEDFPGVAFPISFDAEGDISDKLTVKIAKEGKFVEYKLK